MKKILILFISVLFLIGLCGCTSVEDYKEIMKNSGYEIIELDEEALKEISSECINAYDCQKGVKSGFYAVAENGTSVSFMEFYNSEDLDKMYKQIKSSLNSGEKIDLDGNIVIYGNKAGVDIALD